MACVVDKVTRFAAELDAPGTDAEERLVALKFLLHLVGDMHQPLHASDNHDNGGNSVKVTVDDFRHKTRDELHGFWDTQFVDALGRPPAALANQLLAQITPEQEAEWKQGMPDDWAVEAFNIAFDDVHGPAAVVGQCTHGCGVRAPGEKGRGATIEQKPASGSRRCSTGRLASTSPILDAQLGDRWLRPLLLP